MRQAAVPVASICSRGGEEAQAYLDMHAARLATFGIPEVRGIIFVVNEPLSAIDRAPL